MVRKKIVGQSLLKTRLKAQTACFESERFSFYELNPGRNVLLVPEQNSLVVLSVFSLSEITDVNIRCEEKIHCISENSHNLVILNGVGSMKTCSTSNPSFYLSLSPDFVMQQTGQRLTSIDFPHAVETLSKENLHVTPEMRSIINELITCERTGILKQMFIESKILKLLMLQLEQHELSQKKNLKYIKEYDVEKIHQAKIILDGSIAKAVSLIELAHLVGLNDFKLKRGFKEIYNTTVYNYLYEQRMQEAKKMLLNSSTPVNEIASSCGY